MKTKEWKDTEIGRIPKDWEVKPLGEIGFFSKGSGVSRDQSHSGNLPCIRYGEIYTSHNNYIREFYSFISPEIAKQAKRLKNGDILFACSGETKEEIGKTVAFVGNEEAYAGGDIIVLSPNVNCSSIFLGFVLNAPSSVRQKAGMGQGDAVVHIHKESLAKVLIPFPPKEEQQRIAKTLSDIDMLIASLDKAIEKKRLVKQGAMQQLLTGKKRLKGFTEGWKIKRIGDIGYTYNGLTGKSKGDFGVGTAHYVTFLNILNNPIIDTALLEKVNVALNEKQNEVRKGDLFFNTSSETPEEVGICATIDVDIDELYLNSFCFGFRLTDRDILSDYLAYYFRSSIGRQMMTMLAQGATRYNLSKDNFLKCRLLLPGSLVEQQAIIDVLSIMDGEISSITHEREKYLRLKEGMMQELLTGKTRLI